MIHPRVQKICKYLTAVYPQKTAKGIQWAFTGGLAVALLTEGWSTISKANLSFKRPHKDIDIVSFTDSLELGSKVPHDFYLLVDDVHPVRVNPSYEAVNASFHLDVVKNYHFDSLVPTQKETVEVTIWDTKFVVVAPEHLILLKCFPPRSPHVKHYEDSLRLAHSVQGDFSNLLMLARQLPCGVALEGFSPDCFEQSFLRGEHFKLMTDAISKHLQSINYPVSPEALSDPLLFALSETFRNPLIDAQRTAIELAVESFACEANTAFVLLHLLV